MEHYARVGSSQCKRPFSVFVEPAFVRILIADDNQMVRRGLAGLLSNEKNIEICGEATNAAETLQMASELRPEVILLDVSMPDSNGLETARLLRERLPESKILIVSQHDAKQLLPGALKAGADGCVDKGRLFSDLLPALRSVAETDIPLDQ